MNKVITYTIIGALVFILGWVIGFHKQPKQQMPEPIHHWHTDIVYDTVTDVQYQNKCITRHDTAYLQCIDTLYDSVLVEVPVYQYKFDTAGVKASVSGYNVTLDSLEVEVKIITDSVIVPFGERKWRWGFGFALGFGYVY